MFFSTAVATATVVSDTQFVALPDTNVAVVSSISGYVLTPNSNSAFVAADSQVSSTMLPTKAISTGIVSTQLQLNAFFPPDHFKFIFGANAAQNINTLTIQKSDIPQLTPAVNNTAESLLVGLLAIALSGKNVVEFPEITFNYWGYGQTNGKRIDTIVLDLRNQLTPVNQYELPSVTAAINPNDY